MILGGTGCQKCKCKPCQACNAVCDETPAANFETVHVLVGGDENLSDGILEASGDTDPTPAYPGGSTPPYEQVVSGSVALPSDRFPCYARLQLWRNEAAQEPGGSPTMDLDYQYVLVTCTAGKIRTGGFVLSAGESILITTDTTLSISPTPTYVLESGGPIPLVGGDGNQSGSPPPFLGGTFGAQAECIDPVTGAAGVSFYAKIAWSEEAAYHVLYGRMVECYDANDEGNYCDNGIGAKLDCGTELVESADSLFLAISNQTTNQTNPAGGGAYTLPDIENTWLLSPSPSFCNVWIGSFQFDGTPEGFSGAPLKFSVGGDPGGIIVSVRVLTSVKAIFGGLVIDIGSSNNGDGLGDLICGSVATLSGTATVTFLDNDGISYGTITFDWELSL